MHIVFSLGYSMVAYAFFVFFQLLKSEMQSNRVFVNNAKNNSLIILGHGISYIQQSAQFRRHTLLSHTLNSHSATQFT